MGPCEQIRQVISSPRLYPIPASAVHRSPRDKGEGGMKHSVGTVISHLITAAAFSTVLVAAQSQTPAGRPANVPGAIPPPSEPTVVPCAALGTTASQGAARSTTPPSGAS